MTQIVPISGPFGPNPGIVSDHGDAAAAMVAAARKRKKKPVMAPVPPPRATMVRPPVGGPPAASLYPDILAPSSSADMQTLAGQRADAELKAELAPILRAKQEAARRAMGAQASTIGFTKAAQDFLGTLGINSDTAYADAQGILGNLGLDDGAQGFANIDAQAMGQEGAASSDWASQLGRIQGDAGQEQLGGLMYQSQQDQKDFDQQMIDLAAKRPDLLNQNLDTLWNREMDKLKGRQGIDSQLADRADALTAETGTVHKVVKGKIVDTGMKTLQGRAQSLYEHQFGYKQQQDSIDNQLTVAKLKLQNNRDQAYIDHLNSQGARIDAAASKVRGHIVLQDGSEPVVNGGYIPVAKAAYGKGKTPPSPASILGKATKGAKGLVSLVVNPTPGITSGRGKYIASPTAKGVFSQPDPQHPGQFIRTTNDPAKARRSSKYSYEQAVTYLQSAYAGLTAAQAKKALRAAGWTP